MYIGKTPVDCVWMSRVVYWNEEVTMNGVTSTHGKLMSVCGR